MIRRNRSRRAGTFTRRSLWARRIPEDAAPGNRVQLGAVATASSAPHYVGGGRGAGAVRAL